MVTLPMNEAEPVLIAAKGQVYRFTDRPTLIEAMASDFARVTPLPDSFSRIVDLDAARRLIYLRIGDEVQVEIRSRTETDPANPFTGKLAEVDGEPHRFAFGVTKLRPKGQPSTVERILVPREGKL